MPKSKNRRKHKQKVRSRRVKEKERKNVVNKMQQKMMQDLINKEAEQGKFNNVKSMDVGATNSNVSKNEDGGVGFGEGPLI